MARKDGTDDLRIKKTQKAIKNAFYDLLKNKSFDQITVKDLTEKAMISRNTFYLHYKDKYELYDKICDDLTWSLFMELGKQLRRGQKTKLNIQNVSTIFEVGANTIDKDKKAYETLLNCSGSEIFEKKLQSIIRRFLDLIFDENYRVNDYSKEYFICGVVGLIKFYSCDTKNQIDENNINDFVNYHLTTIIDHINAKEHQIG